MRNPFKRDNTDEVMNKINTLIKTQYPELALKSTGYKKYERVHIAMLQALCMEPNGKIPDVEKPLPKVFTKVALRFKGWGEDGGAGLDKNSVDAWFLAKWVEEKCGAVKTGEGGPEFPLEWLERTVPLMWVEIRAGCFLYPKDGMVVVPVGEFPPLKDII